jgi:FkbM family methyltransferase
MNFYAEFESDKYVREHFFSDYNYHGTLIEVGAGPVEFYSFSKHFRENNWRCIGFEPNTKFYEKHKKLGHEIYQLAIADFTGKSPFTTVDTENWGPDNEEISYSALSVRYPCPFEKRKTFEVDVDTLDNILPMLNVSNIDILTVDTEGWELDVMRGLDTKRYRPKVIVLENYLFSNEYDLYMESIDYKKIHQIEYNFFYIPKS